MGADRPNGTPDAPAPAPSASVADLAVELADCNDRLLRALAEQENVRRRAQRTLEDAVKFAGSNLARDLLPTVDNLRRAIESVPPERQADETVRQLLEGIAATERGLLETLGRHNIRRIDALGEPFDPDRHEAVFEVADSERPAGTVAQELQPGFVHHDRLLRPAIVGVTKGGADSPAANPVTEGPNARP